MDVLYVIKYLPVSVIVNVNPFDVPPVKTLPLSLITPLQKYVLLYKSFTIFVKISVQVFIFSYIFSNSDTSSLVVTDVVMLPFFMR